ncbi:unnamed protein product [Notodromas monacha]|uniref:Serpin domain-containing protein n=1 Tax=Notodromas monacha TaxID=399045 RepID=A0A7R9C1E9_9CRUS|nr:unnamed protein product [Notodromas monacha]CAG0924355.1 unnamed protein product [Notodromas monacha]
MAYKALKYFDKIVMNERQQGSPPPPPPQPPLAPDHQQQSFTLDSANRIYFESSLSQYLNGETAELLKDEIRVVDFRSQAEVTRGKINDWVSRVTRGKIPELLSSDAVSPATIMALVNAAYFKGKWLNQFAAEDTDPATFILDNAARDMITVPTMKLRDALLPVGVSETLKATVVELPYASGDGNDLSMYVIVPASSPGWNLDDVLERFSVESFAQARDSVVRRDVNLLTLPKFKIETTFELLRPLNNLGLGSMFVPAEADFGCLSANLTSMAFSVAQHQAVIEVNEEGTEAAAATAFISLRSGRITPTEIKINRPFLYALYHKDTDSVLFMGVVRNPLLG